MINNVEFLFHSFHTKQTIVPLIRRKHFETSQKIDVLFVFYKESKMKKHICSIYWIASSLHRWH